MARISLPAASILALALLLSAFGGIASAQGESIDVELGDFYIDMSSAIPAGPVTLNVTSVGDMPHTITIDGNGVSMTMPETLSNGGSTTWEIDLEPGTYTFYCPIGGHRAAGMELTVTVEGAEEEPTEAPAEPTATTAAPDPTATTGTAGSTATTGMADPTATTDDDYTDPSTSPATPTALPGLPDTGAGGSTTNGLSNGALLGMGLAVVLAAMLGAGMLYQRQRRA